MIKCKCFKCNKVSTFTNFKQAWMEGWEFVKEIKNNPEQNILGLCDSCPSVSEEEKAEAQIFSP